MKNLLPENNWVDKVGKNHYITYMEQIATPLTKDYEGSNGDPFGRVRIFR